jgi:ribosome-binding factor A
VARRPPRKFSRSLRVNEVVRQSLADELERMADPRLELVTITGVEVSPDLRHAIVYYGALDQPDVDDALRSASPRLRSALGREVRMKYVPALHFREDPSIEAGQRIEQILRDLHEQEPG